jgi:GNAT superfamily N-acetyltransferase
MTVYLLQHVHTQSDDTEDVKVIGVYTSRESAQEAIGRLSVQPGFGASPDGFSVDAYLLDKDEWTEGYVTEYVGRDSSMVTTHHDFELDDSLNRIDFERVHLWLASSYWSPDIDRCRVERAAANSAMVVGSYADGVQVGYLRVVSDKTTFAWICDVIVDEAFRGRGIGRALVRFALDHPDYQTLRRWVLATRDAQGVYAECGFQPIDIPERWMMYRPNPVPGVDDCR